MNPQRLAQRVELALEILDDSQILCLSQKDADLLDTPEFHLERSTDLKWLAKEVIVSAFREMAEAIVELQRGR